MTMLINGKQIARNIRRQVKTKIADLDVKPRFAVVQVGGNPASTIYVKHKLNACKRVGIETVHAQLDTEVTEANLRGLIEGFNNSSAFHGILVQLPLPSHIRLEPVIEEIHPNKDVDGLHPLNVGRLTVRSKVPYLHPCTSWGIVHILDKVFPKDAGVSGLRSKKVVVVGQSMIVGRPLAIMLQNEGATVSMCDKFTPDLKSEVVGADVIVTATGVPGLIDEQIVAATGKDEVTVIDAGIARLGDEIVGDADPALYDKVHAITPVPGGVGPVTVAFLIRNILKAYCIQSDMPIPTFE